MINTCMSPEFRKKVERDGFGINIEPEDVRELVNAVEWMYENEAERNDMGNRARKIAEEQFDPGILWENRSNDQQSDRKEKVKAG